VVSYGVEGEGCFEFLMQHGQARVSQLESPLLHATPFPLRQPQFLLPPKERDQPQLNTTHSTHRWGGYIFAGRGHSRDPVDVQNVPLEEGCPGFRLVVHKSLLVLGRTHEGLELMEVTEDFCESQLSEPQAW